MKQSVEKSVFDWSKGTNNRILAKGVVAMAMLSRKIDDRGNIIFNRSTRCVWNNLQSKSNVRYLERRIWVS